MAALATLYPSWECVPPTTRARPHLPLQVLRPVLCHAGLSGAVQPLLQLLLVLLQLLLLLLSVRQLQGQEHIGLRE